MNPSACVLTLASINVNLSPVAVGQAIAVLAREAGVHPSPDGG
jgi:hypothetical protein